MYAQELTTEQILRDLFYHEPAVMLGWLHDLNQIRGLNDPLVREALASGR